jgi:hypothetical protein
MQLSFLSNKLLTGLKKGVYLKQCTRSYVNVGCNTIIAEQNGNFHETTYGGHATGGQL